MCSTKEADFETIRMLGRGAYGEVHLVRHKYSHRVFAMKKLNKVDMLKRAESAFYWEKGEIMAIADSQWCASPSPTSYPTPSPPPLPSRSACV